MIEAIGLGKRDGDTTATPGPDGGRAVRLGRTGECGLAPPLRREWIAALCPILLTHSGAICAPCRVQPSCAP